MRELFVILVVLACCSASIAAPQIGLLGYIGFALSRPDELAYSELPFSMLLAIVLILTSLFREPFRIGTVFRSPISLGVILLQLPIGLSVLMAVHPQLCTFGYSKYIKVVITMFTIPWLVYSEVWLRRLVLTIAFALGLIAVKFALFAVKSGGAVQFQKGHAGFMSDNNGLALAMAMLIPICWHARKLVEERWLKFALIGCTTCAVVTIVLTYSRGGAIALAAVMLLLVARSKYKTLALVGVAILSVPAIMLVGSSYVDRLSTLSDVTTEASAFSRIVLAKAAIAMWLDYPLFGVGFGEDNWVILSSRYLGEENFRKVHNTYLQMLVDSGLFAFLQHSLLVWGSALWLGSSAKTTKRLRPGWEGYPYMLQAAVVTYGIGSTFYSRPDFELFYIILMTAAAWHTVYTTEVLGTIQAAPLRANPASQPLPVPNPFLPSSSPLPAARPLAGPRRPQWAARAGRPMSAAPRNRNS